jgi:hypothetical protein
MGKEIEGFGSEEVGAPGVSPTRPIDSADILRMAKEGSEGGKAVVARLLAEAANSNRTTGYEV